MKSTCFVALLYCHSTHCHPDFFDVLRNKCILDLNGESGDDTFTVRSFIAVYNEAGELEYNTGIANLRGGYTKNCTAQKGMEEGCEHGQADEGDDGFHVNPGEDLPNYLVNSLVDIDGGTGKNRMTVVGTENGDRYVIQDGAIFGMNETVVTYLLSSFWYPLLTLLTNTFYLTLFIRRGSVNQVHEHCLH